MHMEIFRTFSRIIVGIVFIFSGFVKGIDPMGSTYKFIDYFNAFGLGFLVPLALSLAIILSTAELLIGIGLLYGYRMRFISWAVFLFMSFFTILTFVIAITNPVTDCGCFGDALILTNWHTFFKSIVLFIFATVIFIHRNKYQVMTGPVAEWSVLTFFLIVSLIFSFYNYNHLPLIDFRPFSIGSNIPAGMEIPENAPVDKFETKLIYKNKSTGIQQTFSIENFPDDSLWEFVSSDSKIISKGYVPPIHDFNIVAPNGQEITDQILNSPDYTFLLVSYNLNEADRKGLKDGANLYKIAQSLDNIDFYALTATIDNDILSLKDSLKLEYDFCSVDEIVLKTIIRSNPGLLLLKNGTIIAKWHYNDFPSPSDLGPNFERLIASYPLPLGADLNKLKQAPLGSRPDIFKTTMLYKNVFDGHTDTFPPNFIPPKRNWEFISSNSLLIKRGFNSPIFDLRIVTTDQNELSDEILLSPKNTFLVIMKDPQNIEPDLMDRINKLTTLTGNPPALFYGLCQLTPTQALNYNNLFKSPVVYYTTPGSFIEKVAGDGICMVWLQHGKVAGIWKNKEIPTPDKFEMVLLRPAPTPSFETSVLQFVLKADRSVREKQTTYLFIIGFVICSLLIRIFLEEPFLKSK